MTHKYSLQIFYEDTDAGGVVYHANYLKFMERARTVFLQDKGFSFAALADEYGIQLLVKSLKISYEKPAFLQQTITVVSKVISCSKATLTFSQDIYFDPADPRTMICSGEVVVVCTNLQIKPCAIPAHVLEELKE